MIWVWPELGLGLSTGPRNCPPGSGWRSWRVRPAAKAPEEPAEEWKARKVERRDAATVDGENRPFEGYARGCGRHSASGCRVLGKGPLLVGFGNVAGRRRGNLTEEPCGRAAGGGNLERRESLVWEGLQEG